MYKKNFSIVGDIVPKKMDKSEEKKLYKKIKEGDERAKELLIEHNIRLVMHEVMTRFKNCLCDKEELIAIGNIGLVKAAMTYDETKQVAFSTYAARCIDNEILMHIRKQNKVSKEESIENIIYIDKENNELSLIEILKSDVDIAEEYCEKETIKAIRKLVDDLEERDRKIMILYFGFHNSKTYTTREIGMMMNLSQPSISRIIKRNVEKIGNNLQKLGLIELRTNSKKIEKYNQNKNECTKIEKNDYIKLLEILTNGEINNILDYYSEKEVIILLLKLGYINGKDFSSESIAEFLDINKHEVINVAKSLLRNYKEQISSNQQVLKCAKMY